MKPSIEAAAPPQLFINGDWHESATGKCFSAVCPADSEVIASVPDADERDVDAAVRAASAAFDGEWSTTSIESRYSALMEFAARIERDKERLAAIEVVDTGSTTRRMNRDVDSAVRLIRMYAGLARLLRGHTIPVAPGNLVYTLAQPYGVIGHIIPFNHPLMFAAQAIAASVASGNTVVLKPSEYTPLTTLELAELSRDLFPPGVINVLTGFGPSCGAPLVRHGGVKKVFFRGSVPVGREVSAQCASKGIPFELELGGKNPFIVFPDADIDAAVVGATTGLNLGHQGQSCGAATRLFVHEDVYDKFREGLIEQFSRVKVGLPWLPETEMGALVAPQQFDRVMRYLDIGRAEGASVIYGGERPSDPALADGLFVLPTIFEVDDPMSRVATEEIFGPVTCLLRWSDQAEMLSYVNGLEYGLTSSVWTKDLDKAHDMAARIQAGVVWVNQHGPRPGGVPFGGSKGSGTGKELALEELEAYTQEKTVMVAYGHG